MNALKKYRRRKLRERIEAAFAPMAYPGDGHIVGCSPEHLCECSECREALARFQGKHWRDFLRGGESLPYGYADWTLLSPAAWRFFLPAHLIAGMDYYGSDIGHLALFHLTPPESGDDTYFEERIAGLTAEQREAVKSFIEFLREEYSREFPKDLPALAPTTYWRDR